MKSEFATWIGDHQMPQEEWCAIQSQQQHLTIGLPKESFRDEKRFPLTPESVAILVATGFRVVVQSEAALGINYSDLLYAEAGAEIVERAAEAFLADVVLKINLPTLAESQLLKDGATLITLQQIQYISVSVVKQLLSRHITAVAFDQIRDQQGGYPFADILAEVDGAASIIFASGLMTNQSGGKGILLGGIPGVSPSEVVIIGAGLAGYAAARAAIGLGASVKLFDNRIELLRAARQAVGVGVFTSNLHPNVLAGALRSADVVIGCDCFERWKLSEELVQQMKKGALLIDLCIGRGCCFETSYGVDSPQNRIYERYGVLHCCMSSAASLVARTASVALSNLFVPLLTQIGECRGVKELIKTDLNFRESVYLFNGKIVSQRVADRLNVPFYNISLFLTLF